MYISDVVYNQINQLLTLTFQMNSFADNIAYNLGNQKMVNVEKFFHEKFAHIFPKLADEISDVMLKLNARPVRGGLSENTDEYENISLMFSDVLSELQSYRKFIIQTIELADYNDDYEIKIFLEEFLIKFLIYVNQAEIWKDKADQYIDDVKSFDKDFDIFTMI